MSDDPLEQSLEDTIRADMANCAQAIYRAQLVTDEVIEWARQSAMLVASFKVLLDATKAGP